MFAILTFAISIVDILTFRHFDFDIVTVDIFIVDILTVYRLFGPQQVWYSSVCNDLLFSLMHGITDCAIMPMPHTAVG